MPNEKDPLQYIIDYYRTENKARGRAPLQLFCANCRQELVDERKLTDTFTSSCCNATLVNQYGCYIQPEWLVS